MPHGDQGHAGSRFAGAKDVDVRWTQVNVRRDMAAASTGLPVPPGGSIMIGIQAARSSGIAQSLSGCP
jgi:hypothetical protein